MRRYMKIEHPAHKVESASGGKTLIRLHDGPKTATILLNDYGLVRLMSALKEEIKSRAEHNVNHANWLRRSCGLPEVKL
ncbi:MAG: hypothetical protein NW202_13570 [Nitrospira sp.]|nr:hypothetical protein [Nitrospira sp.]